MIMLKQPLRLKSLSGITYNDTFSEKIRANYEFMTAVMPKEELLHLLLEEPEQEGQRSAVTMIVENIAAVNRNEIMIELLNQLFNRILMVGQQGITYQDNVYISSVLRKLGITDINTFLQRLKSSKEEYFLKNQLLKKYEQEKELLKLYCQSENGRLEKKKLENEGFGNGKEGDRILAESAGNEKENYLYEDVARRLGTMEIYQTVSQWNYMQGMGQKILFHNELALSEQQENVLNMQLAQKKKESVYPRCRMDFISSNFYEAELPENEIVTREKVFAHLLETAVFSLAKSISLAAVFRQSYDKRQKHWYETGFEICNIIKNTLNRCQWKYQSGRISNSVDIQNFLEQQNSLYRYELYVLQKLADSKKSIKESLIYAAGTQDMEEKTRLEEYNFKENSLEQASLKQDNLDKNSLDNKEIALKLKEILNAKNTEYVKSTEKWKESTENFYALNEEEKKGKRQQVKEQKEKRLEERNQKKRTEKILEEKRKKETESEEIERKEGRKEIGWKQKKKQEAENGGAKEKREPENEKAKEMRNTENKKTYFDFYYEIQRIGMAENYFSKYFYISGKKTKRLKEEPSDVFEELPVQISEWIEEIFLRDKKSKKQFYQSKQENVVEYFSKNWFEEESREYNKEMQSDFSKNIDIFYQAIPANKDRLKKDNFQKNTEVSADVQREERINKEKLQKEKIEKAEEETLQIEKTQREKAEKEKLQRERIEKEELQVRTLRIEKTQREKAEKEKIQREKVQKETLQIEKTQREKAEREKIQRENAQKETLQIEKMEKQDIQKEETKKEKGQEKEIKEQITQEEKLKKENTQQKRLTEKEMRQIFHELDSQKLAASEKTEQRNKAAELRLMVNKETEQIKNQQISNQQSFYKEFEKQREVLQNSEISISYHTAEKISSEKTAEEKQQKKLIQKNTAEKTQQIFHELTTQETSVYEKKEKIPQNAAANISGHDMLVFNKEPKWTAQPQSSEKQNRYEAYEKQENIIEKQTGESQIISASHKISQSGRKRHEKNTEEAGQNEISQIFHRLIPQNQFLHTERNQNNYKESAANPENPEKSVLFIEGQSKSPEKILIEQQPFNETQMEAVEPKITQQILHDEAVQIKENQQIFYDEAVEPKETQQILHDETVQTKENQQIFHDEAVESKGTQQILHDEAIQAKEIQQILHEIVEPKVTQRILHDETVQTKENQQILYDKTAQTKENQQIFYDEAIQLKGRQQILYDKAVEPKENQQILRDEVIQAKEIQQIFHEAVEPKETQQIFHDEAVRAKETQRTLHNESVESKEIQQIFHEIETEILHDTQKTAQNLQIDKNYFYKPKAVEIIYHQASQNIPESGDFNKNTNKTVTITEKMTSQNRIKLSKLPTVLQNQAKPDTKQINGVVQVIQGSIQKQINQITEQVYQKIEKKLQNERRRRGL